MNTIRLNGVEYIRKDSKECIALNLELEQENESLRKLLDKASQAIACFMDLRGMTAAELKSAHNGICILLSATKMLDAIKASVGNEARNEKEAEDKAAVISKETGQELK